MTVGERGQLVIPVELRKALNIKSGDQLMVFAKPENKVINMMPEREFLKQNVAPSPGTVVSLDGALARVKSVTSGRVVVDYNHPLAGEQVVYSIKVHEIITDGRKKIEAILSSNALKGDIAQGDGGALAVRCGRQGGQRRRDNRKIPGIYPG